MNSNPDLVITGRAQYAIEILGETYKVTKPSYRDSRALDKEANSAEDKDAVDIIIKHLIGLGIPDEVLSQLDIDNILDLSALIFGPKKK